MTNTAKFSYFLYEDGSTAVWTFEWREFVDLTSSVQATFDMYGYESESDLGLLVDDSQIDALTNLEQLQMLVEVKIKHLWFNYAVPYDVSIEMWPAFEHGKFCF